MRTFPFSLGSLALAALASNARGDTLSGRVLGPMGVGVPEVDIDVFHPVTGAKLNTANDTTEFDGEFTVVVPPGTYRIGFDPSQVPGPTLAPAQLFDVVVAGATDVGDVTLGYGFLVSGRVVGPAGAGAAGVDLDLVDAATGVKAYTPNDNTDALGYFSFGSAPGSYFVQVEPPVASRLVAEEFGPVSISGAIDLGTIALASGVWLSGRVTSPSGSGIAGVDVDVVHSGTGSPVPLMDDPTSALGHYLVVVPVGTFDVSFVPPLGCPFQSASFSGISVPMDTVLDATLYPSGADPTPTAIVLGNQFESSFGAGDEVDEVQFEGITGLLASFRVRRTVGAARPDFELLAPSGASVPLAPYSVGNALGAKARSVPLTETGTYRLLLYPLNGGTGAYALRTKFKAPPSLRTVPFMGTIQNPGDTVNVPFKALANAVLRGKVYSDGGSLDPSVVSLLAPTVGSVPLDGFLLSQPGVAVSILGVTLPEAGDYALRIGGAGGTTGPFTGILKVKFVRPALLIVTEP